MKIDVNRIPPEGLTLEEEISASELDLETDIIKFRSPLKIKAEISRITNAITVNLAISTLMLVNCSRCLKECEIDFKKNINLNYSVNKLEPVIDTSTPLSVNGERPSASLGTSPESFDFAQDGSKDGELVEPFIEGRSRTIDFGPHIREEILLSYPIKPLCSVNCKGICPKCGKNLNEGSCVH